MLAKELLRRHEIGYPDRVEMHFPVLPNLGEFHWRAEGEKHMWDPQAIADLQVAARNAVVLPGRNVARAGAGLRRRRALAAGGGSARAGLLRLQWTERRLMRWKATH